LIRIDQELYHDVRIHLRGRLEQAGFFLADFDVHDRTFVLRQWRPIMRDGYDVQTAYHITLRDEVRPEIIKWAWDADACLVEAHYHSDDGNASFSSSDVWGFEVWVPHVRWRLRGRPYAAIVMAGEAFDGIAWIDAVDKPEQVDFLEVSGNRYAATAQTWRRMNTMLERADGE
jgi:hypothetical protein